ncbi:hypothetical protein RQP46_001825 [Phenoliferia psychrophenolica]
MSGALVQPTSLLSLPNELIVKIAREVAPYGGRKAGNLRLVCRHLGRVVAPVTWASIVLPARTVALEDLTNEMLNNRTGHISLITSVRYNKPRRQSPIVVTALRSLPSLRRLHLCGRGDDNDGIFVPEHDLLLGGWRNLIALHLEHVNLGSHFELPTWAPSLSTLVIERCYNAQDSFLCNTKEKLRFNHVREIRLSVVAPSDPGYITNVALLAFLACFRARRITLHLDLTVQGSMEEIMKDRPIDRRLEPFSFELAGATKLFKNASPTDIGAHVIVRFLNWFALGNLTTLSLPVFDTFFATDVLASLTLPRVQVLVLDVDPSSRVRFRRTNLTNKFTHLIRFLKLASMPSLSTLHLRGWGFTFDPTVLDVTSIHDFQDESIAILGFLAALRRTTVVELRVEDEDRQSKALLGNLESLPL